MLRALLVGLGAALLLLACSSRGVKDLESPAGKSGDEYQATRYSQSRDAAPLKYLGPDDVIDAVPRADPILVAGNQSPYSVNGVNYEVLKDYRNYREQGTASWYGSKFHGHETSNGEIFDTYGASAAHKTLPIPSYARVTNLDNGRSVVVRVNDRGPFHGNRLIDLSYGAAVKLGYMEKGTASVEVEALTIVVMHPGLTIVFCNSGRLAQRPQRSAYRLNCRASCRLQYSLVSSMLAVNYSIGCG
jgi:rare lipoprotein A